MIKSFLNVIKEQLDNRSRVMTIAKYELLSEMRESKLGLFWNIANPCIQIFTYWFVFGVGIRNGKPVDGIDFFPWLLIGLSGWLFISPCITKGTSCIYSKRGIISKMKFPVPILPLVTVAKEFINHIIMLVIILLFVPFFGVGVKSSWIWIFYYLVCAIALASSIALVLSVLNMLSRDVKKFVSATMRMLMYLTPILWNAKPMVAKLPWTGLVFDLNPLTYIVTGYRDCICYGHSPLAHPALTLYFWGFILVMTILGCYLMTKYRERFIDMI